MRRFSSICCAALFVCIFGWGAAHAAQWAKVYGEAGKELGGVVPNPAGGYSLYGVSTSAVSLADQNTLFGQIDALGSVAWAKSIGGTRSDLFNVVTVPDGFLVAGTTNSYGAIGTPIRSNLVWAKFDPTWNQVYANVFGGTGEESGTFLNTADGGLLFAGGTVAGPQGTDRDILLIKIRPNGTVAWKKVFNYGLQDVVLQAVEVGDGYVVAGTVVDPVMQRMGILVMKFTKAGGPLWSKLYTPGLTNLLTMGGGFQKMPGGDFLIVGQMTSLLGGGGIRTILARIDSLGAIRWQNSYGSTALSSAMAFNVIQNGTDQTLTVSGTATDATLKNSNILVMKLNANTGAVLLQNKIGQASATAHNSGVVTKSGAGLYLSGLHWTGTAVTRTKVLYGKLNTTTFAPTWAKIFGGQNTDMGALFKTASGFLLGGTTRSFGVTPNQGNLFGIVLDASGRYPGCHVGALTLLATNPGIVATPLDLTAATPTLTARTAGNAAAIVLPAVTTTLPAADICAPIAGPTDFQVEGGAHLAEMEPADE